MPRTSSQTVVASPATSGSTKVAEVVRLTVPQGAPVDIEASIDLTIGTTGNAVTLTLRRGGSSSGPIVATFGPFTAVATNRNNYSLSAVDLQDSESVSLGYNLTCQVSAATAQSTVNGVYILALW